ncbi:hypothetical protein JOQ06_018210, partial [Pogonophryne albipinna]
GECGEGGTGPLPGYHPEREGAREQLRKEDHPIGAAVIKEVRTTFPLPLIVAEAPSRAPFSLLVPFTPSQPLQSSLPFASKPP